MADPLIHEIPTTATSFAGDDYIVLDGVTNGTRNMTQANLKNSVVAGTIAPLFDPTKTSSDAYAIGDDVIYDGEWYSFKATHYGAWDASHVNRNGSYSDYVNHLASASSLGATDVITVTNSTDGKTRKMSKNALMTETAQATLAGNLAPAFDPNRTENNKYVAGESVIYEGETYTFKVDHYGSWNASDVYRSPLSEESKYSSVKSVSWQIDYAMSTTGAIYSGQAGYKVSDYIAIPLSGIGVVLKTIGTLGAIAVYDKDKVRIGCIKTNSETSVVMEQNVYLDTFSGAAYIRVCSVKTFVERIFVSGKVLDIEHAQVVPEHALPFDYKTITTTFTDGYYQNQNGNLTSYNGYKVSDYVAIPETGLYLKCDGGSSGYIGIYDKYKRLVQTIAGTNYEGIIYTSSYPGAKYIRFSVYGNAPVIVNAVTGFEKFIRKIQNQNLDSNSVGFDETNFLNHDKYSNLIDYTKLKEGYYVKGKGVNAGCLIEHSAYKSTCLIPLKPSTTYYCGSLVEGNFAFFDSNLNYVIGGSDFGTISGSSFTTPASIAYGAFTVGIASKNMFICEVDRIRSPFAQTPATEILNGLPENPCDYSGLDAAVFAKGVAIGDSLTEGVCNYNSPSTGMRAFNKTSWVSIFQRLSGILLDNQGHAGSTAKSWWNYYGADADFTDCDFAIIAFGVNEALTESWDADNEAALDNIIAKLKVANNNIKIFVSTIFPSRTYTGANVDSVNVSIRNYVTSKADNNVILIDLAAYGKSRYYLDYWQGHATAIGYMQIAKDIYSYIGYLIKTKPQVFSDVQFIGTNYSY